MPDDEAIHLDRHPPSPRLRRTGRPFLLASRTGLAMTWRF